MISSCFRCGNFVILHNFSSFLLKTKRKKLCKMHKFCVLNHRKGLNWASTIWHLSFWQARPESQGRKSLAFLLLIKNFACLQYTGRERCRPSNKRQPLRTRQVGLMLACMQGRGLRFRGFFGLTLLKTVKIRVRLHFFSNFFQFFS